MPLLLPTIVTATILRSVDLLRFFDIIYITTQGGPGNASNTLNIYGFRVGFEFFNIGYASALMLTLTAIVFGAVSRSTACAARSRGEGAMDNSPLSDAWIRRLNAVQLVIAGILIMLPTAWMVLSSFKPSFEVTAYPPTLDLLADDRELQPVDADHAVLLLRGQQPDRDSGLGGAWPDRSVFRPHSPCRGRGYPGRRS